MKARSSPTGTCTARGPAPAAGTRAARPQCRQRAGRGLGAQDRRARPLQARRISADDADGYHRVQCPAAMGKIRCPLRPASMRLDRDRPEILQPPEHAAACCAEQTITVRRTYWPRPRRSTTPRPRPGAGPQPAHRRRTRLRHHQGPRQQRHRPRLVPPDGPSPPDAVRHDPAHRPQPAHPERLEHPPERNPAPRSRRTPENPQTTPQDPRRPRRRTALTRNRHDPEPHPRHHQDSRHNQARARPDTGQTTKPGPPQCRRPRHRTTGYQATGMSDPNVKIGPTET